MLNAIRIIIILAIMIITEDIFVFIFKTLPSKPTTPPSNV